MNMKYIMLLGLSFYTLQYSTEFLYTQQEKSEAQTIPTTKAPVKTIPSKSTQDKKHPIEKVSGDKSKRQNLVPATEQEKITFLENYRKAVHEIPELTETNHQECKDAIDKARAEYDKMYKFSTIHPLPKTKKDHEEIESLIKKVFDTYKKLKLSNKNIDPNKSSISTPTTTKTTPSLHHENIKHEPNKDEKKRDKQNRDKTKNEKESNQRLK